MFRTFRHVGNVMSSDETSYSKAMNSLANQVWERGDDSSTSDSSQSRIEWIRRHLVKYHFENDRQRFQERMERKLFHLTSESKAEETKSTIATDPGARISVLDVGSCYNPFAKFPEFDVVAIDLSPTPDSDVYRCDFVSVGVVDRVDDDRVVVDSDGRVTSIVAESFDSVVFCLLLEYLPTARLRFKICRKAFDVLKVGGLFVVVTPDSSHQGKNLGQVRLVSLISSNI